MTWRSGTGPLQCFNWAKCGVALLIVCLFFGFAAVGQTSREHQFKAVCLARFAQFVEWPTNTFADARSPFVIGVLGRDPFGADLDTAVQTVGLIRNRPLVVQRYRRAEEASRCHVLFISNSEEGRMEGIFRVLNKRPVLTVGETDGFVRRGGMIRFMTVENKLRFKVNPEAARAANLRLDSKLLKWAEVAGGQ